jgi:hypothetical protein
MSPAPSADQRDLHRLDRQPRRSIGHEEWFYYYLAGIICLSLIIYSTMRSTKHASAMHRHE